MAHEFDSGMFTKTAAWHGLGTVVDKAPSTAEAIKLAGMDWSVIEQPLITCGAEGTPELIEGWKCLKRSDNNFTLHVCRDTYTPLQNIDSFQFFDGILQDGDATLDAAISLQEGKRIAITAKIKGGIGDVLPGDPVEQYLVLYNGHDGSLSVGVMFSNIRVVCSNTLGFAIRDQKRKGNFKSFGGDDVAISNKMIRIRHTASVKDNLGIVRDAINLGKRQFDLTLDQYRTMANTKMTTELFKAYLTKVFADELADNRPVTELRNYERLEQNFHAGIGMDIKGVQGTAWAGYQAVTEWVTHQRGDNADIDAARNRLNQLWFGQGAQIIERAHKEALALV